jgi:hypothetical protein
VFQTFTNYIGGIAVFLIFSSFVGLIAPQKKYKEYIDLIMAFSLILILLNPIGNVMGMLSGGMPDIMSEPPVLPPRLNAADIEQTQKALVLRQYENELAVHLKRIVETGGIFEYVRGVFDFDDSDDYFGMINGIEVLVREKAADTAEAGGRRPFIRVERVEVTPFTRAHNVDDGGSDGTETDGRLLTLKNVISSFYQIGNEHINILMTNR